MSVKDDIARQERQRLRMSTIGPKVTPRKPRISTKQQVDDAVAKTLADIMTKLNDAKRALPTEWMRGYNAAMTQVANYKLEPLDPNMVPITRTNALTKLIDAADILPAHQVLEPLAGMGGLVGMIPDPTRVTAFEVDMDRCNHLAKTLPMVHLACADIRTFIKAVRYNRILFVSPRAATDAHKVINAASLYLAADSKLVTLITDSAAAYLTVAIDNSTISESFACDDGFKYRILTIET